MADRTRAQIADFVKATIDDKDKIEPEWLFQSIAYSQVKIQLDMMELGIKQFTKKTWLFGPVVACPLDMIPQQNAIIDIRAAAGITPLAVAIFTDGKEITISSHEPGSRDNETIATFNTDVNILTPFTPYVTTAVDEDGLKHFTIRFKSGSTTIAQILTLFLTDPFLAANFTATSTDTGVLTHATSLDAPLDGGAGGGWFGAREYSIEKFNRLGQNSYTTPSSNSIAYKRTGDNSGVQQLEFNPPSVIYSELTYYYLLAPMTLETSLTGLGIFEELLVIDVTAKCYEKLRMMENSYGKQKEYQTKADSYKRSYMEYFDQRVRDKRRLGSEDPED